MICVAVSETDFNKCMGIISKMDLSEIRLDLTGYSKTQVDKLFSSTKNLIATCRPNTNMDEKVRKELLLTAIKSGARYVDIEMGNDFGFKREIIEEAKKHLCDVIISYHNFEGTPSRDQLSIIIDQCFDMGADVAKVACMIQRCEDNAIILSLYQTGKRIVALGMGELGKISRIAAPLLGAEFTFASANDEFSTAPGQLSYTKLKTILELIENS
jgi:3-dehydroquinate dehydratase-1